MPWRESLDFRTATYRSLVNPWGTHTTRTNMNITTNRTITVQGKASLSQSPDRIRIVLTVIGSDADFSVAVSKGNRKTAALHAAAEACSIPKSDLKTGHFHVREETAYESGRTVHIGFQAIHELSIVLPVDKERVGRFLSKVLRGRAQPKVSLGFEVSDVRSLRQRVLAKAVKNAKDNAETIASATEITLGSILNVQYGYSELRISSRLSEMAMEACMGDGEIAPDIEPTDVEIRDTVTVTWEIVP